MGVGEVAVIKLAQKIHSKHSLPIPFDIEGLIKEYAELCYKEIPIEGIDGVSINIKVPNKTPTIIVNSNLPTKRQLFTLAHELGHIIIPWHIGTILDDIYSSSKNYEYMVLEQEANSFAAELLMPKEWILNQYKSCGGFLNKLHKTVAKISRVSDQASAIRLTEILPPNIIFTAEENGLVLYSGRTAGTMASLQEKNQKFKDDFYSYVENYSLHSEGMITFHWWKLKSVIQVEGEDDRPWRIILNEMSESIKPKEGIEKFKKSINGIIAYVHGQLKKTNDYCFNSVFTASIYKLRRSGLEKFVSHPDFEIFVKKRVQDFFFL